MKRARAALLALGCAAALSGCGQKGPLYLPDKKPSAVQPAPAPQAGSSPAAPAAPATPPKRTDQDDGSPPQ